MALATLTPISISKSDFEVMLQFAKLMYSLKNRSEYWAQLKGKLPQAATIQPDHPSMLMGFDFHLTDDGPRLIEINNNAAGLFSYKTNEWLEQPKVMDMIDTIQSRINAMFPSEWQNIIILDELIEEQYFYREMQAYARLLERSGRKIILASPKEIIAGGDGFLYVGDIKIDGIYNRHTDFYLESEEMIHIKDAYLSKKIELSPHPRSYALIGDKTRMADWWSEGFLESLDIQVSETKLIRNIVPITKMLSDFSEVDIWRDRKMFVFKPTDSHGGKGVLIGKSLRKKRFQQMLDQVNSIVVQEFVAAPVVMIDEDAFKYDIRLYTCGKSVIGIAARLFQGSVTNFRSPNSGFYPVKVVCDE